MGLMKIISRCLFVLAWSIGFVAFVVVPAAMIVWSIVGSDMLLVDRFIGVGIGVAVIFMGAAFFWMDEDFGSYSDDSACKKRRRNV